MRKALLSLFLLCSFQIHCVAGSHQHHSSSRAPSSYQHSRSSHYHSITPNRYRSHKSTYSTIAPRDSNGRIKRSSAARTQFERQTGYPHGRKGYVIDHVVPLSMGGADAPSNMQWQTKEAAKEKDKWERGQHASKKSKH